MAQLKVPIRVVFYRTENLWWAHCLEFDLMGDGESQQEALHALAVAVEMAIADLIEHGDISTLFSPAEGGVFLRFAAGTSTPIDSAALELDFPEIRIERPEVREFLGTVDEVRDAVPA
jgi:hypothetical protein